MFAQRFFSNYSDPTSINEPCVPHRVDTVVVGQRLRIFVKRQFLLLASLRFAKLGLTVGILVLYARAFGIGIRMDSWVFATGVTASVGMALWGPVNEIMRSRFVRQVAESGEETARANAVSLLVFTSAASVLVCIALFLFAHQIVGTLYASGQPGAHAQVLKLFALMLPSIVIGQALSSGTAYMNCYDVIYAPEFLGIASAILNLGCAFLLSPILGIYSLVVGYYLGAAISLTVVVHFLRSRGFLRGMVGMRQVLQDSRSAMLFAAPLFFAYGAGQVNGILEKYLASLLGVGVMSTVNYASQIKSTLQAVLASVLFSLVVPRLTQSASQEGSKEFRRMVVESQRLGMVFVFIFIPFVFGTADALAAILFGKAASNAGTLNEMTMLIRFYIVALVPVALYLVYGVALLAQQKGRAYATLGMAAQALSALICVGSFRILGSIVFPIAMFCSHLTASLLMLQRIEVQGRRNIIAEAGGFTVVLATAAILVFLANRALVPFFHSVLLRVASLGLLYGIILSIIYLIYNYKKRSAGNTIVAH